MIKSWGYRPTPRRAGAVGVPHREPDTGGGEHQEWTAPLHPTLGLRHSMASRFGPPHRMSQCVRQTGCWNIRAIQADVRDLPFPVQSFDCLVSTSTLDHFSTFGELRSSLEGLIRLLHPSGQLLLKIIAQVSSYGLATPYRTRP